MAETPPTAQLVLAEMAPGVEIAAPEGLRIGDGIPIPSSAGGRWITLGAGSDQDIILRDEPRGVRRSHCRLTYRNGAYLVQGRLHPDGYAINGERFTDCTAHVLHDGDLLTIGKHVTLRFEAPPR